MRTSENLDQIAGALAKAQSDMEVAPKATKNTYFGSNYADLASVWTTAKKVLPVNGLSIIQTMEETDGTLVTLNTRLLHISGQWVEGTVTMVPKKSDPQSIGSCITYARRYSLGAILGLVTDEDDDGNRASGRSSEDSVPSRKAKSKETPAPAPATDTSKKSNTVKARELWNELSGMGMSKEKILEMVSATLGRNITLKGMEKLSTDDIAKLTDAVKAYSIAQDVGGKVLTVEGKD